MRTPNDLDLAHLVSNQHYGLAGMVERAALIGAHLHIGANQPSGTRVEVRWQDQEFFQKP
jgi:nitrate/nitrite-specific signal transduction histidine kinase